MDTLIKSHRFCYGHRLPEHKGKCRFIHGHNAEIQFELISNDENRSMIVDFGSVKQWLCNWIDDNWDHRFLVWDHDPVYQAIKNFDGVVPLPFTPTAENLASYIIYEVAPKLILDPDVDLIAVGFKESENNYVRIAG